MEILEFIFSDIPHFIGSVILIDVVFSGIEGVAKAIRNKRDDIF